jgi:hypothetical protein
MRVRSQHCDSPQEVTVLTLLMITGLSVSTSTHNVPSQDYLTISIQPAELLLPVASNLHPLTDRDNVDSG